MLAEIFQEYPGMRLRRLVVPVVVLLGLLSCVTAPAGAADLAAHRALYKLTLKAGRGDVTAASGTMSYEVLDACDGWAVRQRLAMTLTGRDGQDVEMLSDYTTWESKDGLKMTFRMRETTDRQVTSEVAGDASLDHPGGAGEAHYTVPADATKKLPAGTLFPMAHTDAILKAALVGKKFLALPLFDGTGPDGAQDTSVVISSWSPPEAGKWPALAMLPSGRVQVAFFDRAAGTQQPDYEVGMRYWENGIADDLSMDFGDFVMTGQLSELTVPKPGC
jgi:hypothetical protein